MKSRRLRRLRACNLVEMSENVYMKTMECYDCDQQFQAEAREEILGLLYDHYMKDHKEIITGASEEEKKAWMVRFEKDWSAA